MPLWLDLLRTPMAAPETGALRRMRLAWQRACLALAVSSAAYAPLHRLVGALAPCLVGAQLAFVLGYGGIYGWLKHRADAAWLAVDGETRP